MFLRQSTGVTIELGPFVDSTDLSTETGLSLTVKVKKNGGTAATRNSATAITHDADGYYNIPLSTTDTNTLGILRVYASPEGALPLKRDFLVLPAGVYDALVNGTELLGVEATDMGASAQAAMAAALWTYASRTLTAATNLSIPTTSAIADAVWDEALAGHLTAGSAGINLNYLSFTPPNATAIADAVWDEQRSGHTTAGSFGQGIASVQGNVTGSVTGSVGSVAGAVTVGTINSNAITASSIATDALTAAKLAADAGTEIAAAVWANATRTLSADTNINYPSAASIATQVWGNATRTLSANTNLNDLNATAVANAVWNALRSNHTTANTFGAGIASVAGAVGSVTDSVSVASLAANSVTASALAADAVSEIVSALLGTSLPGAYGSGTLGYLVGNAPTTSVVRTQVDNAIEAYRLNELLQDAIGSAPTAGSVIGELTEDDSGIIRFNANALELAPTGGGASISAIADEVWNRALSGHTTAGTAGKALSDAQSAGDPWATAVPGSYTSGQAGHVLDVINDAVAALPTAAAVRAEIDSNSTVLGTIQTTLTAGGPVYTNITGIKAKTDLIPASPAAVSNIPTAAQIRTEIDSNSTALGTLQTLTGDIESYLTNGGPVYDNIVAIKAKTDTIPASPAAVGDIPSAASIATQVLGTAVPGSFANGTLGKIIGTNLDAAISSRGTSTHSATDVWSAATRTLTSGGEGGGASAADIWAYADATSLLTNVTAIKAKTDNLPATPAAAGDVPDTTDIQAAATAAITAARLNEVVGASVTSAPSPLSIMGHLLENNAGAYRYKAAALAQAPSGELNIDAATVANAILDEPTANHVSNGTVGKKIHELTNPTTDHIASAVWRAAVASYGDVDETFGDYIDAPITGMLAHETGNGSETFVYTVTNSLTSLPIPDVIIAVTTDAAGQIVIARGITNSIGQVTFHLDPGTYYLWRSKTGFTFTNPDPEIITEGE